MSLSLTELAIGLLVPSLVVLVSCSQLSEYDVTLNNVTVYQAARPNQIQPIEDAALETCLRQLLVDQRTNQTTDLTAANCSDAGIRSLAGIEQFTALRSLKLSGNAIRNLVVLERLEQLEQLWLNRNDVVDPIPMLRLTSLRELDLTDNPLLQCPAADETPLVLKLSLPEHCEAP
jgi:hypothetical protein